MNRNLTVLLGIVGLFFLIGTGLFLFSQKKETNFANQDTLVIPPLEPSANSALSNTNDLAFQGEYLAKNYYAFTKEDYDRLQQEGKPVLLFFYANWCPTCAVQEPIMITAMNSEVSQGLVALRVNYNDTATDESEKSLAAEFGVTYQHTFVGVTGEGKQLFIVNGQQSEADLADLFSQLIGSQATL